MPKSFVDKIAGLDALAGAGGVNPVMNKTYSVTWWHVQTVKDLFGQLSPAARRKFSESRLVRDALAQFAETFDPEQYEALLDDDVVSEREIREHPGFASVSRETVLGRADFRNTRAGSLSGAFRDR